MVHAYDEMHFQARVGGASCFMRAV
jgi:hypothetical protein